jgi:hypothetical protein
MKRILVAAMTVLIIVALAGLIGLSRGSGAAAAAGQYKRPALSLVVHLNSFGGTYDLIVVGSGYTDEQPGGTLVTTCKKGVDFCGPNSPFPPNPWPPGPVDPPDGSFSFDYQFYCSNGLKSAQAIDANGVKSSPTREPC